MEESAIAIGVIRRGDCLLVGLRPPGGPLSGYSEFPGGKCRPDESLEECVVRECREETGLRVIVRGLRRLVKHAYGHGHLQLAFFDCELLTDAEVLPPFRWVPRQELAALRFPEANREVIGELVEGK